MSVTPPTGVTIKTITYNGETVTNGQEINLAEGANFNVQFNVANDAATTSVDSSIDISLNGIKVASAPVNVEDAQKAAAAYGAKVQEIFFCLSTRYVLLIQAYNSFDELKNKDVSESLSKLFSTGG